MGSPIARPVPIWVTRMILADRLLAVGYTAGCLVLLPIWVAVPLSLLGAGTLGGIAGALRRRYWSGHIFQTVLLVLLSLPWAWSYRPFGLALPAILLHGWFHPDIRAHFGMGPRPLPAGSFRIPSLVVGALVLAVSQIAWLHGQTSRMFIAYQWGFLAPLANPLAPVILSLGLTAGIAGLGLRRRWAGLLMPALLTPGLMAVCPVGHILFAAPLLCLPSVRAWCGALRPGAAALSVLPAVLGLALHLGYLPAGMCYRDGHVLRLAPCSVSTLLQGSEATRDPDSPDWEPMRIRCPADEAAVARRLSRRFEPEGASRRPGSVPTAGLPGREEKAHGR